MIAVNILWKLKWLLIPIKSQSVIKWLNNYVKVWKHRWSHWESSARLRFTSMLWCSTYIHVYICVWTVAWILVCWYIRNSISGVMDRVKRSWDSFYHGPSIPALYFPMLDAWSSPSVPALYFPMLGAAHPSLHLHSGMAHPSLRLISLHSACWSEDEWYRVSSGYIYICSTRHSTVPIRCSLIAVDLQSCALMSMFERSSMARR